MGQLANSLFLFAHFIANSIEYEYKLINLAFYEYCFYFDSIENDGFLNYSAKTIFFRNTMINRNFMTANQLFIKILSKLNIENNIYNFFDISTNYDVKNISFDMNDKEFIKMAKSKKLIFIKGWLFRDRRNFKKYSPLIRKIFKPNSKHLSNIIELNNNLRANSGILIGVHIRRGDYKNFKNGKYYYENRIYVNSMCRLKRLFPNEKLTFLMCSNEEMNLDEFNNLNVHLGTGNFIEDLYSLARCDYIIGPPSTYSMWASFYGQVPLFQMKDKDEPINLNNFNIVSS